MYINKLCIFTYLTYTICKESIATAKKFDFEILTYLYVLGSPDFIYAIFMVKNVCMCMWMWVKIIMSKRCIQLSSNFVCPLQITIGRTLLILVNIGWIVFFTEVQKRILIHYSLWNQILQSVLVSRVDPGKILGLFSGPFTKFYIEKTATSQNSTLKK